MNLFDVIVGNKGLSTGNRAFAVFTTVGTSLGVADAPLNS